MKYWTYHVICVEMIVINNQCSSVLVLSCTEFQVASYTISLSILYFYYNNIRRLDRFNVRPAFFYTKPFVYKLCGYLSDHDQTFTSYCLGSLILLWEVSRMVAQNFLRYRRIKNTSLLSPLFACLSDDVVTWLCDVIAAFHLLDMKF